MLQNSALKELREAAHGFSESEWPALVCPACGRGHLAPSKIDMAEAAESLEWREEENWEPDFVRGYFHGELRCNRLACREVVVVVGKYRWRPIPQARNDRYESELTLQYSLPALRLLQPPAACPALVVARIDEAAQLLFADPGAAANRIRVAIEELLTAQGVRKVVITKQRKRQRLTTHNRIAELKQKKPKAAEFLEAVKWIGNNGSHAPSVSVDDVLDGAELLDHALRLIYDEREKELTKLATQINARKGIARPRRRARISA